MDLFGRKIIYTDVDQIDGGNILDVVSTAMNVHRRNVRQINYLYHYYKGDQPILNRQKKVRPEICNKIVENRANEIVAFKVGYLCGEPIQYVSSDSDNDIGAAISLLNGYMRSEGKENKDRELIEWDMICGTAYRMILPDEEAGEEDEAPFEIFTLDPRNAFVIYSNRLGKKPLAGVYFTESRTRKTYSVYTKDHFYEIIDDKVTRDEPYTLGIIPIIEYPANSSRLGAFEIVISMLDAINLTESNRMDGIEQFIQSLAVAVNCQFPEGTTANSIREAGMIILQSLSERPADFKILAQQLDQSQTQTVVDNMYETVLTITGMPNRNGGTSTSDTGAAVVYRDGWSAAETRAKDSEAIFKESENIALRLVLRICKDLAPKIQLKISDISIKFTRRNFENTSTKATVLTTMLSNDKIAPRLAFLHCGMFTDPEAAYQESKQYAEERERKADEQAKLAAARQTAVNGSEGEKNESGTETV